MGGMWCQEPANHSQPPASDLFAVSSDCCVEVRRHRRLYAQAAFITPVIPKCPLQ